MVEIDSYRIFQYTNENKLTILLPPTPKTARTSESFAKSDRKVNLNDIELASILTFVKYIYEGDKTNGYTESGV